MRALTILQNSPRSFWTGVPVRMIPGKARWGQPEGSGKNAFYSLRLVLSASNILLVLASLDLRR